MDNFNSGTGGGGRDYPPLRNTGDGFSRSSSFNDPPGGGERGPPMQQPYANGMLSRPGGGGGASVGAPIGLSSLQREDSLASISGVGSRTQQASHEVFMVREAGAPVPASRSNDRSSYPGGGSRFQQETNESMTGGERGGEYANQNAKSSSHPTTSSHHRDRGERERDKDKEKESSTKLVFPKMLKIAVVGNVAI